MDKYYLPLVIIQFLFFCCQNEGKETHLKESKPKIISYQSSVGWDIHQIEDDTVHFIFQKLKETPIYAGSIVELEFSDSIKIHALKLKTQNKIIKKQAIEFKLYLNNQYVGTYYENMIIPFSKKIKSLKIIFIKTGNEQVIHAWDENFYYALKQDTSCCGLKGISFEFAFDTIDHQRFGFIAKKLRKRGSFEKYKTILFPINKGKPFYLSRMSRLDSMVSEQISCFDKSGKFQIDQIIRNTKTKEIESEIYFSGIYFISINRNNSKFIHLDGEISGLAYTAKEQAHRYKLVSEIHSNGFKIEGYPDSIMFDFPDQAMVNIKNIDRSILVDIPYAGTMNITGKPLYSCNECYLRYLVVKKLLGIRKIVNKHGFDIKMWDCYRPLDVQKLLYDAFPVKGYVADPIGGSIHNRGTAIDITLTNLDGNNIDMGSEYDDFSTRSHFSFTNLPDTVLKNRQFLHRTMQNNNFVPIRMEWWHFELVNARKYKKMNDPFPCND